MAFLNRPKYSVRNATRSAGEFGEYRVNGIILTHKATNRIYGDIVQNLILKIGNFTHEIDTIYVCEKGILVIETKSWKGTITGSVDADKWYQKEYFESKPHYNPVKQNATHVRKLKQIIGDNFEIKSLIVFKTNNVGHLRIPNVINLNDLTRTLDRAFSYQKKLSKTEIDQIIRALKQYKIDNPISKKQHIVNVHKYHK